jgi:hypothetical protein
MNTLVEYCSFYTNICASLYSNKAYRVINLCINCVFTFLYSIFALKYY